MMPVQGSSQRNNSSITSIENESARVLEKKTSYFQLLSDLVMPINNEPSLNQKLLI